MRFDVRAHTAKVQAALNRWSKHAEIPPLVRSIGNICLAAVVRNFAAGGRSETGASGTWPKLKPSTLLMRRGKSGAKPLQDTRALMNGIHPESSGNKIVIATAGQPYDAIHHFGGTTHPTVTDKMKGFMWHKAKETGRMFSAIANIARGEKLTVKILARPYMMLTQSDIAEIEHTVLNYA